MLPVSLCEPDKAIRVALGERHVEKCAMRKTLSGGFWTVSPIRDLSEVPMDASQPAHRLQGGGRENTFFEVLVRAQ